MKKSAVIASLLAAVQMPLSGLTQVPPSSNPTTDGIFNVRSFGAIADGKANDRSPIQKAIDQCSAAGGGTVQVPAGTYATCGIVLRSHVTLHLDEGATLQGPSKISDYPKHTTAKGSGWSGSYYGMVAAEGVSDVAITGQGRIDSAGQDSWAQEHAMRNQQIAAGVKLRAGGAAIDRPRMIQFNKCQNIHVSGVTLANSQMWTLVFNNSRDIQIDGLTISAPADSPETDGIDIRGCHHTRISHCQIDNGDDNVAVTGSRTAPAKGEWACEDVEVSDCIFLHGHGVSIGSPTENGVRNVRVHDCTFDGTTNGIRIKSMRDRGGIVEDVHYDNLKMTNVNPAITINAYYQRPPATEMAEPVTDLTPMFRDIHITNLTATCPKSAGMIVGLPESHVLSVSLENVHITAQTGITLRDVDGLTTKAVDIEVKNGPSFLEGPPAAAVESKQK